MKVWAVEAVGCCETELLGIFDSKAKADAFVDEMELTDPNRETYLQWWVTELELNVPKTNI